MASSYGDRLISVWFQFQYVRFWNKHPLWPLAWLLWSSNISAQLPSWMPARPSRWRSRTQSHLWLKTAPMSPLTYKMTSRLLHRASKASHNLPLSSSPLPPSSFFPPPHCLSMTFLQISNRSAQQERADKTDPNPMLHMQLTLGKFQCLLSLCACFAFLLKCIFKPILHISLSCETFLNCPCSSMITGSPFLRTSMLV